MATEYELTFHDYLSIFRSRFHYLIGIFVTVLLVSIVVAFVIPPTYRATGTIMVESQNVPGNIVPSATRNQLDDQISSIEQRVTTRESLLQIANKYGLLKENVGPDIPKFIDKMRDRITVETVNSSLGKNSNRQGPQAITFTISFEDQSPEIALDITNDLVAIFQNWYVKLRAEGAAETTDFISAEATKLKAEVDQKDKLIAAYKQQHSNALPEQLTLRTTMLAQAQNDLSEVERDYRSTQEELRALQVELAAAKQGMGDDNQQQSLPALKAEYTRLLAVYNESYPDMVILKRKIDALEKATDNPAPGNAGVENSSPAVIKIQAKIASDNYKLSSLEQQRALLQGKISENESALQQTPKIEQGLDVLIRDRDSAQKKYEELINQKMNAKIAQSLQSDNMSERFSVLEPPILPVKPFKPNRGKIIVLGFLLALVSSGGGVMLLESLEKRIRGTEALSQVLGNRPLAVIPYLFVKEEEERNKRMLKLAIIAAVVAIILALVAVNFLYMPLHDLL